MTGNLLGESFNRYVRDQIEIRQQLYGSGYDNNLRSTEYINYLNNKNAWIKMASSVSVEGTIPADPTSPNNNENNESQPLVNIGEERLKKIGIPPNIIPNFLGTNLAEKAILFNGLSSLDTTTKNYNNPRAGVVNQKDSIWNENFAYGLGGTNFGIQPMPGIIDFSVDAVNRGSIRKGTITIKAYNRFQFELIELLYIRLGYTMLVEWGWDKYATKNPKTGEITIESTGNTIIEDLWFTQNDYTQIKMLQAIERYREEYNGNYDGFFGKVSNFDWQFNPDGSYDITLNLITVGDVIESLKIQNKVVPIDDNIISGSREEQGESTLISTVNNNIISQHLFLTTQENNKNIYFEGLYKSFYKDISQLFEPLPSNSKQYFYYIGFSRLLDLIRDKIIPNINSKNNNTEKQLSIETGNLVICNSYKNLISLDPRICLIKPEFANPNKFEKINNIFSKNLLPFTFEREICEGPGKKYTYGNIMNIYLNYEFVAGSLKSTINDDEVDIYSFLSKICQGINKALGGVINLEPIIKDDYIITIIEQNPLPVDLIQALGGDIDNEPVPLEVYGYNTDKNTSNFVKNISFKTKITPQLSSQITIGATADGTGTQNMEATAFSSWNKGLSDRFTYGYNQDSNTEEIELSGDKWNPSDDELTLLYEENNNQEANKRKIFKYTFPNGETITIEGSTNLKNSTTFISKFREESKRIQSAQKTKNSLTTIEQFKYENTWEGYLDRCFSSNDLKYFEFNSDFISKGQDIFSTTYNDLINKAYKNNNEVINTIGFIPIVFDLTLDGLSGIKIYQKLEIQQDFLPYQYPEAFDFLITKVNHKISNNGWETQLNTISTSNLENLPSEPLTVIGNVVEPYTGSAVPIVLVEGEDPAPIINPNRIGANTPENTPVFRATQLNFRNSTKQDVLNSFNRGEIILIGQAGLSFNEFAFGSNNLITPKLLDNRYYLQATAGREFLKWIDELRQKNISFTISSALRFGENTGGGAHGYGIAIDFSNLFQLVGGSTDILVNKNARIQNPIYKQIAEIGTKYGWYNPWRLSDTGGDIDEIWHFEYWGPA